MGTGGLWVRGNVADAVRVCAKGIGRGSMGII